jgi:hypothetical protein
VYGSQSLKQKFGYGQSLMHIDLHACNSIYSYFDMNFEVFEMINISLSNGSLIETYETKLHV